MRWGTNPGDIPSWETVLRLQVPLTSASDQQVRYWMVDRPGSGVPPPVTDRAAGDIKLLCETESIKAEMGRYSQSDLTWMGEAAEV